MPFCTNPRGWLVAECEHGCEAYVPLRCRVCEDCRIRWYGATIERITQHLAHERWVVFLTLTSTPNTQWSYLTKALTKLLAWLRRRGVRDYVCAREVGSKSGMRHCHLILTGWLWVSLPDLRSQWEKYTGAHQVKIKRVPVNQSKRSMCARYVAKYVGKGLASVTSGERPSKCMSFSAGWSKLIRLPSGWRVWWERKLDFGVVSVWTRSGCGLIGSRPVCDTCFGELPENHQKASMSDEHRAGFPAFEFV